MVGLFAKPKGIGPIKPPIPKYISAFPWREMKRSTIPNNITNKAIIGVMVWG